MDGKQTYLLPVVIEQDNDGYVAYCPSLQGCYTQGDSYEEVLANIEDAIRLHIENRLPPGDPLPFRKDGCACHPERSEGSPP